jgi:hypothetical protein
LAAGNMTTDQTLIREVRKLADCEKIVKAPERETIKDLLEDYIRACSLSRGPDKKRGHHWANVAYEIGQKLQRWHEAITGVPWIDKQYIPHHRRA